MILKIRKSMSKLALLLAFFLLLLTLQPTILRAGEDVRSCDWAFKACIDDGPTIWFAFLGQFSYCFIGWVFCKKYVERI